MPAINKMSADTIIDKSLKKVFTAPPLYVIPLSILLSEILTMIFSTFASLIMWGRVPREVLIIGVIDAFAVSFIVVTIVLFFLNRISGLTKLNEKLQIEVTERRRAEDALHKVHDELELKVLERTFELSESNKLLEEEMAERQKYEEQIRHMAYYDGLTGLPNRTLFEEHLKQRLFMSERQKAQSAVLFIDVDDFKRVNDTLGHVYGDALLKKIAQRLLSKTRKCDSVTRQRENDFYARRGGDEFTVMLSVIREFDDAALVARRIIDAMSEPFLLDEREILITVSIGIAIYPHDGRDVDTLLKNADAAMYDAKEKGKNNYQYYRQSMNATALARLNIEGDIKKAIEREEFILHYQPQVETRTGNVVGVEALIRWQHPEKGMISPLDFIPVAEQTGLIIPISEWVVESACRQNRTWKEDGVADIPVSVNLTSHQFQQKNFISNLRELLEKTGLPPQSLKLEITESTLMKNTEMSFVNLYELSHIGLGLIIDDFGTGYSSLSYLKRFPIHAIKIDRSFVQEINTNTDDEAIASAIISMAHKLNMKVIAEGVETEEQLTLLRERGCDEIQGYLISRPLSADDITAYLLTRKKTEGEARSLK